MTLKTRMRRLLCKVGDKWLLAVAGLLTGLEALIQFTGVDWMPGPHWIRFVVIISIIGGAFVARVLAQQEFDDE
jgi:hypothetical protein